MTSTFGRPPRERFEAVRMRVLQPQLNVGIEARIRSQSWSRFLPQSDDISRYNHLAPSGTLGAVAVNLSIARKNAANRILGRRHFVYVRNNRTFFIGREHLLRKRELYPVRITSRCASRSYETTGK
uniref:(northern house mosquito) hypothetical protein n=1 Tax=Culex pipiens TaxID=7175 RepID=A0A8D8MHH1_CULPI